MTEARFGIRVPSDDTPPLVVVFGEIDLANVGEFDHTITTAAGDSPELVVDLTGVTYCDSSAVRSLFALAAVKKLTMIVSPTGHITTLLGISGLDRVATVVTAPPPGKE